MPVESTNVLFLLGLIHSSPYSCEHLTNSYVGIFCYVHYVQLVRTEVRLPAAW